VLTARDGPGALALLAAGGIELVLLDVMMPAMDGIEVCRRVRQELRLTELTIVFVTALSDRDSRMRAKAAGANDFLVKPVDSYELAFRAHQWLKLGRLTELYENVRRLAASLSSLSQSTADVSAQLVTVLAAASEPSEGNAASQLGALTQNLSRAVEQLVTISADSKRIASQARDLSVPPPAPATSMAPRNQS
jgi:CheY-like chemotaxis protein